MSTNEQEAPTREGLKIMALRERVATLTAEYEDKVADLRVELTIVSQELEERKRDDGDAETGS